MPGGGGMQPQGASGLIAHGASIAVFSPDLPQLFVQKIRVSLVQDHLRRPFLA